MRNTSLKNIGNQSLIVLEVGSVDGGNEGKTVGSDEGSDVGTWVGYAEGDIGSSVGAKDGPQWNRTRLGTNDKQSK